jgi:hypothetical protein
MKKLLLVGFLLFVTYGMVYSGTLLTIISPNGGEKWPLGSKKDIQWIADKSITNNVKLILFKNGTRVGLIAKDLNPRGCSYFWWTVGQYQGGTAKVGSGYKIVIKEQDGTARDESDNPFFITWAKKPPHIRVIEVTNPKKGDTWNEGETRIIQWVSVLKPPFKVELYRSLGTSRRFQMVCEPTKIKRLIIAEPNKHWMGWKIPKHLPTGNLLPTGVYLIRVSKGTSFDFSEKFSIVTSYTEPE